MRNIDLTYVLQLTIRFAVVELCHVLAFFVGSCSHALHSEPRPGFVQSLLCEELRTFWASNYLRVAVLSERLA